MPDAPMPDGPMPDGPLTGLRVLEFAGLGPAPHACMILADLGADVIRVERRPAPAVDVPEHLLRGRRIVAADLTDPADNARVLALAGDADVLVEGFRPGVLERLGLGPDVCLRRNPRLIYGRVTGWGQDGPLAPTAGHDINYLALTGVLESIGRAGERPVPPLNLLADFGGGSMVLLAGVLAALWERDRSGRGQVVDAAMYEGVGVLAQIVWALRGEGRWSDERGTNLLDGSRPYYDTYECADGRCVAVGCLEPRFFAEMLRVLGLDPAALPGQYDESRAGELRDVLAAAFRSRTMAEWASAFAGTDACVTPYSRTRKP